MQMSTSLADYTARVETSAYGQKDAKEAVAIVPEPQAEILDLQ